MRTNDFEPLLEMLNFVKSVSREFIDKKVGKEKHVPRFHAIPKTATDNYVGNEVGVYPARRDIEGKVMCPWCKQTTFGGKPGIVCSVWPHHNWVYSAVNISGVEAKHSQKLVESGNAVSPLSKRHAPDEWRVNDTRRYISQLVPCGVSVSFCMIHTV